MFGLIIDRLGATAELLALLDDARSRPSCDAGDLHTVATISFDALEDEAFRLEAELGEST